MTMTTATEPIEFRDGDRIVLIGNTFIERAQTHGHLETWLTTALADRHLSFRNLGWSGDTVFGHARSYFGPPAEGLERLTKHLEEIKPTLLISAYGGVAAFEGEAGLEDFVSGYGKLLDIFADTGARVVLMSPPPAENLSAPLPNQDAHNERLALYRDAIENLAAEKALGFADVFGVLRAAWSDLPHPLTDNGMHFTSDGYAAIAPLVGKALGIDPTPLELSLDVTSGKITSTGLAVESQATGPSGATLGLRIHAPVPSPLTLAVNCLEEGRYHVRAYRPLARTGQDRLAEGLTLAPEEWNHRLDDLRQAILRKNELFFHRWRPQNETYLFGFRKHEQGNNAAEIPRFDPLIERQETLIAALKHPVELVITIHR